MRNRARHLGCGRLRAFEFYRLKRRRGDDQRRRSARLAAHDEHATAVLSSSTLNFLCIARLLLTIDSFVVFESDETSTSDLIGGTFYALAGFALVSMLLDAVIARSTCRQRRAPPQRRRQRISFAHAATAADEGIERSGTFIWSSRKESELDAESHDRVALAAA